MFTLTLLFMAFFLISCVFSGSETGIISWNPLKVAHAASNGGLTARLAMRLMNHRGQLLSTVLICNNICNILTVLIFAALFERFDKMVSVDLSRIPSPESWFLTPALLFFSEILPKSLYRTYPFRLTMKSVPIFAVPFFILSPIFWSFGIISKLIGKRDRRDLDGAKVREEIILVTVEGAKRGVIFESADSIMKNTLEMKGKHIESISIKLEDWKKNRAIYRESQLLAEFGGDVASQNTVQSDAVVIFGDNTTVPVGFVSLMDAATHSGAWELKTFGSLMKPLPRLKSGMEILSCLRRMPIDSPRYYAVSNGEAIVGILDKMTLFETVFCR